MKRQIIVTGWYYLPEFLACLPLNSSEIECVIVCHNEPPPGLAHPTVIIPNVGLEYGSYDYFIKNLWKGCPTLFIHDDNCVYPSFWDDAFSACANLDVSFIFESAKQDSINGGGHGRCIYMSKAGIKFCLSEGGIWHDSRAAGKLDDSWNTGVNHFCGQIERMKQKGLIHRNVHIPNTRFLVRGMQ